MEHFDVAIIGGGSSGLAALKQLSNLEKQAVLIDAGKTIGSKNVSGGILYSKKPKNGKVYNVEDVYGHEFVSDAPLERLITKYILHATSKDKVFSIDLTSAHKYQANFGYSVLLNKLNLWFAKEAAASAEKQGGGIIPGVHVKSITWQNDKTIVETDELDEFEVKADIDKALPKEEQLRTRFAVSKLVKTWDDLRHAYYSPASRAKLIESGKYKSETEIKARIDSIHQELSDKYKAKFLTDYVELEYSAKLVPDGKRCRMKKPYNKNILFVGDAAGRGIFVGPRIEGLNVGVDDAVRAANAVARAIDRNNFTHNYMGE